MKIQFLAAILLFSHFIHSNKGQGQVDLTIFETPIYYDNGQGFGDFAFDTKGQPAMLGLFLRGSQIPFATAPFGRGDLAPYTLPGLDPATVPGYPAGSVAPLTVKVWIGPSYNFFWIRQSWDVNVTLGGKNNNGFPPTPAPSIGQYMYIYPIIFPLSPGPVVAYPDVLTVPSNKDITIPISSLTQNDDLSFIPSGFQFTVVGGHSAAGAPMDVLGDQVIFGSASGTPDYFVYQLAAPSNLSTARVDIVQLKIEPVENDVHVSFQGIDDKSYFIEGRSGVDQAWQMLPALTQTTPGHFEVTDTNAPQIRFYRVNINR